MSKINVLAPHIANLIAAGEVVERPANIVKECVENAIDANATEIEIWAVEGGIESLTIIDNGDGMDYEDVALAFKRHATSKIKNEEDLFAIMTMGFRGEALASIAAVAKVELTSNNGQESTRIRYEFGERKEYEKASAPRGTRIEVTELFVHTPARFKFLKKAPYEFSLINDLIIKMALSHPDIRFSLYHNERIVFKTSGSGDKREVLFAIYGREIAQNAVEFDAKDEDFIISGYAIQPKITRASKYFIFISINGRLIRSLQIQNAIIEAYREYMPPNRFPICLVDIVTDPQLVDVNVHPNKWEVRISKMDDLAELIKTTITQLFDTHLETVAVERKERPRPVQPDIYDIEKEQEKPKSDISYPKGQQPDSFKLNEEKPVYNIPLDFSKSEKEVQASPQIRDYSYENGKRQEEYKKEHDIEKINPVFDKVTFSSERFEKPVEKNLKQDAYIEPNPNLGYPIPNEPRKEDTGKEFFNHLRIIGQLRESYILCENENGLVVIDQHAAQERYHFEQLQKKLINRCERKQPLMVPILVSANPKLMYRMEEINQATSYFGITFEAFGNNQMIVREVPLWFNEVDPKTFLEDILDFYNENEKIDIPYLRRHMTATMACHSSIRFNRSLTYDEMVHVIEDLKKCDQPYHCPHGRPTVITISDSYLRKEFERG